MAKTRIELNDTTVSALTKMSDGNPGAITVLVALLREGAAIDPDDFAGGFGSVLGLDTHGIYGEKIWMLYKDICESDLTTFIGLLRGVQLGFMPERELKTSLEGHYGRMAQERITEIMTKVRQRLPSFKQS